MSARNHVVLASPKHLTSHTKYDNSTHYTKIHYLTILNNIAYIY